MGSTPPQIISPEKRGSKKRPDAQHNFASERKRNNEKKPNNSKLTSCMLGGLIEKDNQQKKRDVSSYYLKTNAYSLARNNQTCVNFGQKRTLSSIQKNSEENQNKKSSVWSQSVQQQTLSAMETRKVTKKGPPQPSHALVMSIPFKV